MKLAPRYRISTVREAEDRPERIRPESVFESLRATEAAAILKSLTIGVPDAKIKLYPAGTIGAFAVAFEDFS